MGWNGHGLFCCQSVDAAVSGGMAKTKHSQTSDGTGIVTYIGVEMYATIPSYGWSGIVFKRRSRGSS